MRKSVLVFAASCVLAGVAFAAAPAVAQESDRGQGTSHGSNWRDDGWRDRRWHGDRWRDRQWYDHRYRPPVVYYYPPPTYYYAPPVEYDPPPVYYPPPRPLGFGIWFR